MNPDIYARMFNIILDQETQIARMKSKTKDPLEMAQLIMLESRDILLLELLEELSS